jgi:SEC-C motif domain protein
MRSRYSAYALGLDEYIQQTWAHETRPAESVSDKLQWIRLQVLRHDSQGDIAVVEFIATYRSNGKAFKMHEVSQFRRDKGQWFYVSGEVD